MQIFRKLNTESDSKDQYKDYRKLNIIASKNTSHLNGVGFLNNKQRLTNLSSHENFRLARSGKFIGDRQRDEVVENCKSVTQYNHSFVSNSSQVYSPRTTRLNSPSNESEFDFQDYFVLGMTDQSQSSKQFYHKQSKSVVNPKLAQSFGTSTITEQLSQIAQEQLKLVNQSVGNQNQFVLNKIELQRAQSMQRDMEYAQILQKSAQTTGLVSHSIIQNKTPLKMMLFKDSVEYYKLDCKNKLLPLRIHCTDLTAPFLLAISAKNKYPKANNNEHEYILQFDISCSKKLEFQSLQRYIMNPYENNQVNQQAHQNLISLDQKQQNHHKMAFSQTKTQWIYFAFIGQQFSSFTISTEFQDDIGFKFFNEELFKPQKNIPAKQVSQMLQAKKDKYLSLAQLQKVNKEALLIIKKRKEQILKKSNNVDLVELNKTRAREFQSIEYEKFLNKVNKVQDKQIQKVQEQHILKEEEKQNEIQLKIQIKEYVKKQMQEARKLQMRQQQLIQFRKRWIQLITLNKLITNIINTNQFKNFTEKKDSLLLNLLSSKKKGYKYQTLLLKTDSLCQFKSKRLQTFIKAQYKYENEKAISLLQRLFSELRLNRKNSSIKNEELTSSTFSQLNPTLLVSFIYFLQQLTEDSKKKMCKQYVAIRKQIFRQQYKKHNELLEDYQNKLEQYKQKVKMLEESKMNQAQQTPQTISKNWSNIRKISLAVSLFSGNQGPRKLIDQEKSIMEPKSPFTRQNTNSFVSQKSMLNSSQFDQNKRKNSQTPQTPSKKSISNSPSSNKNSKDAFSFNNAFENYEQSQSQSKQTLSPLQAVKQKTSIRNSLFSPQPKVIEEKIEEPRLNSKRPRLNLDSRKEMEDILLAYLMQLKEKNM